MYVLGIDTSSLTGGVALLADHELRGETVLSIRTTHSERLLPALDRLLSEGGLGVGDLGLVSVVTGPGSFTGIRIGVATAKGLGYALDLPLAGVTALQCFGWQFQFFPGIVLALIDARRGYLFWQAFRDGKAVNSAGRGSLAQVFSWCAEQDAPFLAVGDGAINYSQEIKAGISGVSWPPACLNLLRPAAVAHLGYTRFLAGESQGVFDLKPSYMRKTEAELKWQEQT